MHAHFTETDVYCGSCPDDYVRENKCYGGFARIKAAADNATEWAKERNITSLFVNAGDTFQGTPYYTLFKWKISAAIMNSMGFEAMCLGNHEFDDGIDNLAEYLNHVSTPVLCANLNMTEEPRLGKVKNLRPSMVLTRSGKKIGIIGYLTPDTMTISNTEDVKILDEIPVIQALTKEMKSQGVQIIIALGHSGFEMDEKIAKQCPDLDVIVGGHSHDLLYSPKDSPPSTEQVRETYPYIVTQKSGKKVPIVQSYAYSKYLGQLILTFDDHNNIVSATGNSILLDSKVPKDPKVNEVVEKWAAQVRGRLTSIIGYTRVFLEKSTFSPPRFESNTANFITDAIVDAAVQRAKESNSTLWSNSSVTLYQNGGIRSRIDNQKNNGAITLEDLLTLMPFENQMYECSILGAKIKSALEFSVQTYDIEKQNYLPYFLQFSGMKVVYDLKKEPGNRVEYIEILCSHCSIPTYEQIVENKSYVVTLSSFLMDGGDFFDMFKMSRKQCISLNNTDTDIVRKYIEKMGVIYPAIEGRFTLKGLNGQPSASSVTNISPPIFILVPLAVMLNLFTISGKM